MTKVVLKDAAFVAALDTIANRSQLCDDAGRALGYFVPQSCDKPVSYKGVKSPLSPEERARILREEADSGKTLAEFWDEMRRKHPEQFQ
jgi:hypothetical protein